MKKIKRLLKTLNVVGHLLINTEVNVYPSKLKINLCSFFLEYLLRKISKKYLLLVCKMVVKI
jgi:hypothetical protein